VITFLDGPNKGEVPSSWKREKKQTPLSAADATGEH
jgi:hypothetical protein